MTLKNEDFDTIIKAPLMQGLTSEDVKTAIDCFAVDVLVCSGMYSIYELKKYSMIILEGFIDIVSITLNGDEHIVSRFSAGSYIPNGLMCSKSASSPFLPSVSKNCRILVIDQEKIHHCNCNLFGNCIDNCNQEYALSPLLLSRINYNMAVLLNDILIHLSEKLQIITQFNISARYDDYKELFDGFIDLSYLLRDDEIGEMTLDFINNVYQKNDKRYGKISIYFWI